MKRKRRGSKPTGNTPTSTESSATLPDSTSRRSKRSASGTPAKPSRLQPSTPLHMTTRAASRAASAKTASTTASVASGDSRRSSIEEATSQVGGSDFDSGRPAKRSRISTERHATPDGELPAAPAINGGPSPQQNGSSPTVSQAEQPENENASPEIVQSLENGPEEPAGIKESPESSNPDVAVKAASPILPPPKRRGKRPRTVQVETPAESTDAASVPATPQLPADKGQNSSQQPDAATEAPAKIVKRLPGRRRAPNPNVSIEADLRRQLQLRTAYRAVAKALKPVLAELAQRTVNEVEDDPDAHKQSEQYEVVMAALDEQLRQGKHVLDRTLQLQTETLQRTRDAEIYIEKHKLTQTIRDLKEDFILRCNHEILELRRAAARSEDEDATADEDGVVPRLRGPNGFLDPEHESRSRFYIETQRLCDEAEIRHSVQREQEKFLRENSSEFDRTNATSVKGIVTFDGTQRALAVAQLSVLNLAEAARAVEEQPEPKKPDILPNADAEGLQLLASLAEQGGPIAPNLPMHPSMQVPKPPEAQQTEASTLASGSATRPSMNMQDTPVEPKYANSQQSLGKNTSIEAVRSPSEAATTRDVPSRPSTNRITDILNKEQDLVAPPQHVSKPSAPTADVSGKTTPSHVHPATQAPQVNLEPRTAQAGISGIGVDRAQPDDGYAASVPILPPPSENIEVKDAPPPPPDTTQKPTKVSSGGFWSKFSKGSHHGNARKQSFDKPGLGLYRLRRLTSRDPSPDKSVSEASSKVAAPGVASNTKAHTESPAPRIDNAPAPHHSRHVSGSVLPPHPATNARPPLHPGPESHRRPWNPEPRRAPSLDPARRASIAAPQQYAIHAASPPAHSPPVSNFPQPHSHGYHGQPPHAAPPPFNAQASASQPPPQFLQPPSTAPLVFPFQGYASPYNNPYQPGGYAQPPNGYWPGPQLNPPLAAPQFQQAPPGTAVSTQSYMPATAAAPAPGPDPRFPPYHPFPPVQQQYPAPPYSAPAPYSGPQYGGQPILPANIIPQHGGPPILPANMAPQPSQYSGLPYDRQPHPPPAFSQQQAQGAGSPPNGPPYGQHSSGPRRRHRNFSGHSHKEFRPYNGPPR